MTKDKRKGKREKRTTNIINGSLLIVLCTIALVSCGQEESEVSTVGRLTITGLDAFNGKMIFANVIINQNYGKYLYLLATGSRYRSVKISSGQAILKVYRKGQNENNWKNYDGNEQNIKFAVAVVGTIYGFVTVNFVNGIAEGVFVPDSYDTPNVPLQPVDIEMVNVPGGSFQMGNPDTSISNSNSERPVHTVTLTGFNMGKYEVTQAQYRAIMGNIPISDEGDGDNYPVGGVNWYTALVFCNRLSIANGFTPAYRIKNSTDPSKWGDIPKSQTDNDATWKAVTIDSGSNGYRLPTEAQWEYAARGGNGSPGNYTYAGSNNADDVAWYSSNSGDNRTSTNRKTREVGTKAPNGLGLYDMSGNVWEWCWDLSGSYPNTAQTDPQGVSSGTTRVYRGGSFASNTTSCRSTYRESIFPDVSYSGLRIVRPQ